MEINEQTRTAEFRCNSMCEKCGACRRAQMAMLMEAERIGNAKLGDKVQAELPKKTLLRTAFTVYGIPLILLIAGLAAGYYLPARLGLPGNPELYAAILGVLPAGSAFLVLRLMEKRRKRSDKFEPEVVNIERLCQRAQQNIE